MSTSAVSDTPERSGGDELIVSQIAAAQGRIKATDIMTAVAGCGILLTSYVLLFTLADHWIVAGGFSPLTRAVLLLLVLAGVAVLAWRSLIRPMTKAVTALYAARMLDRQSLSGGALVSLVDLEVSGSPSSERVRRTIAARARTHLQATNLDDALDRSRLMQMGMVLFALILITCLYSVLSPKPISLLRPLTLWGQDVATRTRITGVSPGDTTIPLGGQVEITADISGVVPETVRLLYTTDDREYVDAELLMQRVDDNDRFSTVITGNDVRGIRQSVTYRIHAGDAWSDIYSISVDVPPTATVQELRYRYPRYMQLPDSVSISPALDTWEGTQVTVIAESSVPVAEAQLELCADPGFQSGVDSFSADIDGLQLTTEFQLAGSDEGLPYRFYRIVVQDQQGRRDPSPTVYPVTIRPDLAPVVQLVNPVRNLTVPANATVPLLIRATDPDFLLRSVTLHYTIDNKPIEPGELIYDSIETGAQKTWTGTYDFELQAFNLQPGATVEYTVRAADNRTPRPSTSSTPPLKLTILAPASPEELQEDLESTRQFQERRLEQMRKEQESQESSDSEDTDTKPAEDSEVGGGEANNGEGEAGGDADGTLDPGNGGSATESDPSGANGGNGTGESSPDGTQPNDSATGDNSGSGAADSSTDGAAQNESAPMSDEEAFRRIVENYNREQAQQDQPAGDSSGNNDSTNAEEQSQTGEGDSRGSDAAGNEASESEGNRSGGSESQGSESGGDRSEGSDSGAEKSGGSKSEGSESGGDKSGGSESGVDKSGGSKSEGGESGGDKSGGSNSEGSESGGDKADGSKPQGSESEGDKAGGSESQGSESGSEKSGGSESEGSESSGDKSGGSESGGSEGEGGESGGSEAEGSEGGGSESGGSEAGGGGDSGGGESGGSEGGGGESGGSDAEGSESSGDKSGGSEPEGSDAGENKSGGSETDGGEAGESESEGTESGGSPGESGGDEPGSSEPGAGEPGGGDSGGSEASGGQSSGAQAGGSKPGSGGEGGKGAPGGGRSGGSGASQGGSSDGGQTEEEANLQDSAQAADLALRRLEQDIENGTLDEELLQDLGWTPERLREFGERMRDQLNQLDGEESDNLREELKQRRLKEMLLDLELSSDRTSRQGTAQADREQQDTTIRRREPPQRYRARNADFRRKILDGPRRNR